MEHEGSQENLPPNSVVERRKGLFRRGGNVAIRGAVPLAYESDILDNDTESLFGIEQSIVEYRELWKHNSVVASNFVNSDNNKQLMRDVINDQAVAELDRSRRRQTSKFQEQDFDQFAGIFIVSGRVEAYKLQKALVDLSGNFKNVISVTNVIKTDMARVEAKKASLLNNLIPTNNVVLFSKKLQELEKQSTKTYRPIINKENEIIVKATRSIQHNPSRAIKFLDTFLDCADSESQTEKDFVSLFANDYLFRGENSFMASVIQIISTSAEKGGFITKYISHKIDANNGDNIFAHFNNILKQSDTSNGLIDSMGKDINNWPSDLTIEYQNYSKQTISSYILRLKQVSNLANKKAWLPPDINAYEEAVDRFYVKIFKSKPIISGNNKVRKRPQGTSRFVASVKDTLTTDHSLSQSELLGLGVLASKIGNSMQSQAIESVDDILNHLIPKNNRYKSLLEDMKNVIARLQQDPFGSGVRSIQETKIYYIDGKPKKLYRANPKQMAGISLSRAGKDARVVFVVNDGKLSILAIPRNHKDYENILARY